MATAIDHTPQTGNDAPAATGVPDDEACGGDVATRTSPSLVSETVDPGWYHDPEGSDSWRWWNGSRWTNVVRHEPGHKAPHRSSDADEALSPVVEGGKARVEAAPGLAGPVLPSPVVPTPDMRGLAGWYQDPDGTPTVRYWDGLRWTDNVFPITPPRHRPRWYRRRRAMWIAVAVVAAVAVLGGLVLALEARDTYRADLTTGHGDFPAVSIANTTTGYQHDGFHLRITEAGGFRPSGVDTPRSYSAAEVTATVIEVSSPTGAGFGPWCFFNETNGYGMALAANGDVSITSLFDGNQNVIGNGQTAAWLPGQSKNLAVVCRLSPAGSIISANISAFVDGTKVATATAQSLHPTIEATGFAGVVPNAASGPGEWTVTNFSRQVPNNG